MKGQWIDQVQTMCQLFLASAAGFQPTTQGCLCLAGAPPGEKAFDADVFVHVWPMYALAFADKSPVGPLEGSTMRESWVPRQGNGQRTTVNEFDHERIVGQRYPLSPGLADVNR